MSVALDQPLQEAVKNFMAGLPVAQQTTLNEAFARLFASDTGAQARSVGDKAPEFSLPALQGGEISLSSLLQQGPVVLSFYRGGWCPFCNLEFKALHDKLPQIKALGATLVGISPETLATTQQTVKDHPIEFQVLSDMGNKVARQYDLIMIVDEAIRPLYQQWGIELQAANGDNSYELPLPATYVIDPSGIIRAAHVEQDYTQRMNPEDIITALQDL